MRGFQNAILTLIDDEDNIEENLEILSKMVSDQKICEEKYQFRDFLNLFSEIINNHYRSQTFFSKIENFMLRMMNNLKENFNESEIFEIFHQNKRILLFLINEKIITIDQHLANKLVKYDENSLYFYHETKEFIKPAHIDNEEELNSNEYQEKRIIGENDSKICQIIRNDEIDELESYINESKISLNSQIETSIYETNPYLIGKSPTLIEYAAFFGSINILKYLLTNHVQMSPNLWIYMVHSDSLDLFDYLKDNNIYIDYNMNEQLLVESIKCHHNEITNYILNNHNEKDDFLATNTIDQKYYDCSFHYFNYVFFPEELANNSILFSIIKYDHFHLFKLLYSNKKVNIKKANNYAKNEEIEDIMNFLSSNSSHVLDKTPFPVWEQCSNNQIKLTDTARNRFSSSVFPCIVLLFGVFRSGKSTLASHLLNGAKNNNFSNSIFKVSGSAQSCTHRIYAVGPVKCKDIAALFNINIDEGIDDNKNRDIFIVDSEGLFSYGGEIPWLKQAICSMIPLVNISLYVSSSISTNYYFDFLNNYSTLIQIFENNNIQHGFCFINNQEKFEGQNIMQKVSEQNEATTKNLIRDLSSKFANIDESEYKCLSVLSFDRHPMDYIKSLRNVASFITDICLFKGTKISGNLLVNLFERYANSIENIYENINKKETLDKMIQIFIQEFKDETNRLIKLQEKTIQNDIASKISLIPFHNYDHLDIDSAISEIEKSNLFDNIINNAIKEIFADPQDFYPFVKDSSFSFVSGIAKNALQKIKLEEKQRRKLFDIICNDIRSIKKSIQEQDSKIQKLQDKLDNM